MKRYLVLAAVTLSTGLLFGTSACKKDVPGAPEAGAAVVDAAPAETVATAEVDAGTAAPLTTTVVKPVAKVDAGTTAVAAAGGPYQGTYKCFGNMVVTQKGNAVEIRTFPGKNDGYTTISCTANGDACEGTATEFKGGAAAGKKGAHITRSAAGDITYKGDGENKPTFCKKAS